MTGGRVRAVLACAFLLVVVGPVASAAAASNLEVGMEDERLLLSEPVEAEGASPGWRRPASTSCASTRAGSTSRRAANAMHRPRGFDPANHRSHRYHWETLDRAIDLTRAAGMRVMLSVTGPGRCGRAATRASTTRATSRARRCSRSSRARWRRATATASTAT